MTLWGGGKRGLSTQICLMHLKYVLQYLSFTFEHPKAAITKYCHIEDSAKLQMATLNHINLLFCAVQGPEWIRPSSNVHFSVFAYAFVSPSVAFPRGVCTSPSLRLPAIPEGQADQTRVPDAFFPGGLSCCRHGLPHRHLSHIHRYVCSQQGLLKFPEAMILNH